MVTEPIQISDLDRWEIRTSAHEAREGFNHQLGAVCTVCTVSRGVALRCKPLGTAHGGGSIYVLFWWRSLHSGRSAFRSKQTKRSRSKYDRVRRRAGSPAYAERPCLSQFVSFSLGPALLPALSHFPSVFAGFLLAFSSSYPLAGNAGLPFPRHPVGLPATTRQPRDSASRHRHPSRFKGQGPTPPSQHGFRWSWRHVLRRRSPLVLSQ